jgi:transcriptional regulator GlxA family with amidase domain
MRAQALVIEFHWVNETGKTADLTSGIKMQPTVCLPAKPIPMSRTQADTQGDMQNSFSNCPPLDIVLIGAAPMGYKETEAELGFIRKSYNDCSAFITICGGMRAALAAGILEGKTAAAPRIMLDLLRQVAPGTNWVEKRWNRDGKIWTSGALLNGMDLIRAFGEAYWGGEGTLMQWLLDLGHFPQRDVAYGDAISSL